MLEIAEALATIEVSPVFVGGLVTGLLVTDAAAPAPRPTDDIDLVVEVLTHVEYHALGKRLRSIGFAEDTGSAVLCRWIFKDHAVDVMPTEGAALGMSCRWFSEAYAEASRIAFDNGRELRAVTAPYFLALKLEAFRTEDTPHERPFLLMPGELDLRKVPRIPDYAKWQSGAFAKSRSAGFKL